MPRCKPRANEEDSGIGSESVGEEEEEEEEEEDGPDKLFATNLKNSDAIEKSSGSFCECKRKRKEEARFLLPSVINEGRSSQ